MKYTFQLIFLIIRFFKYISICGLIFLSTPSVFSQNTSNLFLSGSPIHRSIYTDTPKKHGSFYTWLWGNHYRQLYYTPITVHALYLDSLYSNFSLINRIPQLHGVLLNDENSCSYFISPIGNSASFLESGFFRSIYDKKEFNDTYVGDFITEAYTIAHPYIFLVSDYLAQKSGLISSNPSVYYIYPSSSDTINEGSDISDKMVNICTFTQMNGEQIILDNIPDLLEALHDNPNYKVDMDSYIRSRLLDILIGDWNKVSENWGWIGKEVNENIVFEPIVIDRSHSFTKVDGFAFPELLNMLGLGYIKNYEGQIKSLKKTNILAYPLDLALTTGWNESEWIKQAGILQDKLTDEVIENAFMQLPDEMRNQESKQLKSKLKQRRNHLKNTAKDYYRILQKTPVVTSTNSNDKIVMSYDINKNINISIYDAVTDSLRFDHTYLHSYTKEVWLYTLDGNDSIEVKGIAGGIPVYMVGGKGENNYRMQNGKGIKIYESKSQKERLDSLSNLKIIYPNDEESALGYDYKKYHYTKWSFTPIGLYDSDLGLNIGTSVSYTIYGFRRAPYTRMHQLSFDYVNGFTYQGIFPDYDSRKSFHVSAFIGSPAYFSNFFGFGNNTKGYKDKDKKYNRVTLRKYAITPAFYYTFDEEQEFNIASSFEIYKVGNPDGRNRFINTIYPDNHSIFSEKYFMDIGATYTFDRRRKRFVSRVDFTVSSGWVFNLGNSKRNFPYAEASLGLNFSITDKLTIATMMKGKALFTDKYEFYQSATTELRGFRDNRFIGKRSFYQYSDIRWDMGRLENPFTPLDYGLFVGADYGRVWYQGEDSRKWYSSYGGGFWLTLFKKFTGKFSYFTSSDTGRFMFELGMGF